LPACPVWLLLSDGIIRWALSFAQVEREQDDDDPRDSLLLWLGSGQGEIPRAEDLEPLARHADLTAADLVLLRADRAGDADRGPTPLQRTMSDRRQDRDDPV
jgi:hypothetical protein